MVITPQLWVYIPERLVKTKVKQMFGFKHPKLRFYHQTYWCWPLEKKFSQQFFLVSSPNVEVRSFDNKKTGFVCLVVFTLSTRFSFKNQTTTKQASRIGICFSNKSQDTIGYLASEVTLVNCLPVLLREQCIDVSRCQAQVSQQQHT